MFRKDIPKFLMENRNSVVYIGSSNKNIDIYFDNIKEEKNINLIELSNIQEEDDYYKVNYQLLESLKSNKKLVILTSLEGLLTKYSLNSDILTIELGMGVTRKSLIEILEKNGYKKNYLVEKRMEFSVRGDIIDIFPLNGENPIRVEYFGDEIDRITYFSLLDQKSLEKLSKVNMYINKNNSVRIDFLSLLEKIKENRQCDIYLENSEMYTSTVYVKWELQVSVNNTSLIIVIEVISIASY